MSDKRFVIDYDLEELEEENVKLRAKIEEQQTTIQSLKEDNEQLKKEYKIAIDEMVTDYKKVEKENEQLKKDVKELEEEKRMTALQVTKKLNDQQDTIDKLEQKDYYNQSERYKILCRAIELASDYIHTNNLEYYDFCGLVTECEEELLEGKEE